MDLKLAPLNNYDVSLIDKIQVLRQQIAARPDAERLRLRQASMGAVLGRAMYQLVKQARPQRILEIGTCAGVGALYMTVAAKVENTADVEFFGCDRDGDKLNIAEEYLGKSPLPGVKIKLVLGDFRTHLIPTLASHRPFDFVYLDGHHEGEYTKKYFDWVVMAMPAGGIIVADDLNHRWPGMVEAREYMLNHHRVAANMVLSVKGKTTAFQIKPE